MSKVKKITGSNRDCKNLKKIDVGLRVNPNVDAQTHKKFLQEGLRINLEYLKQK